MDSRCPKCGAPLTAAQAEAGSCPACRLEFALDLDETAPTAAPAEWSDADPETIGPYRVLRRLGEGGMGIVYLAEQTTPVRRHVALKVVKRGTDTVAVLTRFSAERQALALMDHPSIARVYEAGETENGLPYFAMEYVEGEPITTFCDRERLTVRQRLELLIEVCRGVQHAHQKGIIHRDIKPSNVLVARVDGVPAPKVIDFGVAKAIEQRLTERTLFTELGQIVGTPEYMSPEQAELTGERVDTRTDVYALGVLQYELLTGSVPLGPRELRAGGFDEICRRIREDDPAPPSSRVTDPGGAPAERARQRNTDPPMLQRQLSGDIDWVTLRALEKDPERRYGSPEKLAEDLKRLLENQPVLAGPPGRVYRIRKFVRRHRLGVTAVAAVVLALLVGASLATIGFVRAVRSEAEARQQAARAESEAETAREVSDLLVGLFQVSDPGEARGNSITAREILDRGAERITSELEEQPRVQARMLNTIARVYRKLGLFREASSLADKALEIRRRELGADHADTLQSLDETAILLQELGHYDEAEPRYREILQTRRRLLGDRAPATVNAINNLALLLHKQGNFDEAAELFEEVIEADEAAENPGACITMNNVAYLMVDRGTLDEAEEWSLRALDCQRKYREPNHPNVFMATEAVAIMFQHIGKIEDAERYHREALSGYESILDPDHPDIAWVRNNLSVCLRTQGKLEESIELQQISLANLRALRGEDHPETLDALYNLAGAQFQLGRLQEAERNYRDAYDRARIALTDDAERHDTFALGLGSTLRRLSRLNEAEPLIRQAREGLIARVGADNHRTGSATSELALVHEARRDWEMAESLHRSALETVEATLGPTHHTTLQLQVRLGSFCSSRDRREEADRLLTDAVERAREALGPGSAISTLAFDALARHRASEERYSEAEMLLLESYEAAHSDQIRRDTARALVDVYGKWGRPAEVESWAARAGDGDS